VIFSGHAFADGPGGGRGGDAGLRGLHYEDEAIGILD
jgi:hypothetical protein